MPSGRTKIIDKSYIDSDGGIHADYRIERKSGKSSHRYRDLDDEAWGTEGDEDGDWSDAQSDSRLLPRLSRSRAWSRDPVDSYLEPPRLSQWNQDAYGPQSQALVLSQRQGNYPPQRSSQPPPYEQSAFASQGFGGGYDQRFAALNQGNGLLNEYPTPEYHPQAAYQQQSYQQDSYSRPNEPNLNYQSQDPALLPSQLNYRYAAQSANDFPASASGYQQIQAQAQYKPQPYYRPQSQPVTPYIYHVTRSPNFQVSASSSSDTGRNMQFNMSYGNSDPSEVGTGISRRGRSSMARGAPRSGSRYRS